MAEKSRSRYFLVLVGVVAALVILEVAINKYFSWETTTFYYETTQAGGVKLKLICPSTPGSPRHATITGESKPDHVRQVVTWKGSNPGKVEVVVLFDPLRLEVEGQSYGTLKSGDSVVVDATNMGRVKVMVNDQER